MHPETLPPSQRVGAGLGKLVARIRALEARLAVIPVPATIAEAATTTSATPWDLWYLRDVSPEAFTVTAILRTTLSVSTAKAVLQLVDVDGKQVDWAPAGDLVTLTATGAEGPLTIRGYTSTGTLSTWLMSASAAPWKVTDTS